MKHYFIFSICFLFSITKQFSQFLPDLGTTISYAGGVYKWNPQEVKDTLFQLSFTKDTIVGGKNCIELSWNYKLCEIYPNTVYLYEEDSIVYSINYRDTNPKVVFDFTKKQGDSWRKNGESYNGWVYTYDSIQVDSVYSVEINGGIYMAQNLKTTGFYHSPNYSSAFKEGWRYSTIIQKIGDVDFFYPKETFFIDCMGENYISNLATYTSPKLNFRCQDVEFIGRCPDIGVAINKKEESKNLIVYPTIATKYLQIETDENPILGKVYDTFGNSKSLIFDEKILDVSSLNSGIYLLEIYYKDGILNSTRFFKE
jgi:hypothetical protein